MHFNKKAAFVTLGCKVNQYETENIKKQFLEKGFVEAEFDEAADVYIVNSCTVTSIADKKTRNMIRRTKKLNENSLVIVTGCYAQTNESDIKKIEGVDLVIGNTEKENIFSIAQKYLLSGEKEKHVTNIFDEKFYKENGFSTLREMSRAYIKIQDGCDNFCSYCKIPFARGNKRSRDISSIIKEAVVLAEEGYKEIILIGINIGAYGEDKNDGIILEDVIDEVSKIEGIERIRIGSIYPDRISDRLIDLMKNNNKFMPHLHISLQAGDDEILKRMKRKYTADYFLKRIEKIKTEIDEASFTGDIITGFPGEKESNFKSTYELLKVAEFADIHIFPYSDRENTEASKFKDKVSTKIKKDRAEQLELLRKETSHKFRNSKIGSIQEVLIEEIKEGSGLGYTRNYLKTEVKNYKGSINTIIRVSILGLEGELLISGEKDNN